MTTNWAKLAIKMGVLNDDGSESLLGQNKYNALEEILGEAWVFDTVDTFIEGRKGAELAIKTLRIMRSRMAAEYAFRVFEENKHRDIQKASYAIWAMYDILHPICVGFVPVFLANEHFAGVAVGLVRNLIFDQYLAHEPSVWEELLAAAETDFPAEISDLRAFIQQISPQNGA